MHAAWHIYEIRHQIFSSLEPQDFARLARICSTLFTVCTDKLWARIASLKPFLHALPQDFRERPLTKQDVQRLNLYADKTQELDLEKESGRRAIRLKSKGLEQKSLKKWDELWAEIAALRPLSDFLPNVRRVCLYNVTADVIVPLISITGAKLSHLSINIYNPETNGAVCQFLESLADTSRLESVSLHDGLIPPKLIQQAPLKRLRLNHVFLLRSDQRRIPLCLDLLEKSTLERLSFSLPVEWCWPLIDTPKGKYLPRLQKLWLDLKHFEPERCSRCLYTKDLYIKEPGEQTRTHSGRYAPALFLEALDRRELKLLKIELPGDATPKMVRDVVRAARDSCQLNTFEDLTLGRSGWYSQCQECRDTVLPESKPEHVREVLSTLLPMPHLRKLRLSVPLNFVDSLDVAFYCEMANGLPMLETLKLDFRESVPLHHLAAFCSMLPNVTRVSLRKADYTALEEMPREEWACPRVQRLKIMDWDPDEDGEGASREALYRNLQTYFPNTELAKRGPE
ncbi:MAG: hypothetical protein Q9157_001118 [Trypethelium eluteriae]